MKIERRFIRFLFVGALNTLFGYSVFSLFIYIGLHYALASFLATILGVLFNFMTIGKLVFESHNNRLLVKFFGVYGILYLLNVLGLKWLHWFDLNMYLAGFLLIFPLAMLSYFMNKKFVFQKEQENT